jgi:hypothetical protein
MEHRNRILATLVAGAQANVERHMMNVEVFLNNPVGVGEHPDIMETIEGEIDMMEKHLSRRNILQSMITTEDKEEAE